MAENHSNEAADPSPPQFVTLGELALEFKMPKSNLRRWAIDRGFSWEKRRVLGKAGNALQAVLSVGEADRLRRARRDAGFSLGDLASEPPVAFSDVGNFYVVAIVPELEPRRLKFGFATNVESRLADHRVIAPTLRLLRSWPCRASWERPAIECLGVICGWVGGEVYQAFDVESVLDRAEQFFALLPSLADGETPFSAADVPTQEELDSVPFPGAEVRRYLSADRRSWLEGVVEGFYDNPAGDGSREPDLRVLFSSRVTGEMTAEPISLEEMLPMSEVEVIRGDE